ncbi:hypothetical protein [Bosea sp. BK604]|uniref:hypothetical protein n=1 Tax=Bosea sp. BK604 TaxID=2512180 RepID=UPI001050F13A|nr:hypothetical protein [Bosea sp. BK604]TCR69984.1 hypothetical protein EV560_101386 [Bosea sp. BK604]
MRPLGTLAAAVLLIASVRAYGQTAQDFTRACPVSNEACANSKASFEQVFPLAIKGDVKALRQVALCLVSGCDGAVQAEPIAGCSWRIVVAAAVYPQVDEDDLSLMINDCKILNQTEMQSARNHAATLVQAIYARPLLP